MALAWSCRGSSRGPDERQEAISFCGFHLCRGSTEADPDRPRREADEPRILHRRLPVLDRFPVDGVADHSDEGGDARVLSDEAEIPALLGRSDQRLLEDSAPDDQAAEARENWLALPPVSRISLSPGRSALVRIGGVGAQFDQIEHMDRADPVVGAKGGKSLFSRIDGAGHATSVSAGAPPSGARLRGYTICVNAKRKNARDVSAQPSVGTRRRAQARSTKRRR